MRTLRTFAIGLVFVFAAVQIARADDLLSRLTLNITPKFVLATEGDQGESRSGFATDTTHTTRVDYGGVFKLDKLDQLEYQNFHSAYTLGRVYLPTANGMVTFYNGASIDILQTLSIRRQMTSAFQINAGYAWRSRSCCPGDNDPHAALHAGYGGEFIGTAISFAQARRWGPLFTYTARALYVPHQQSAALQAQYPGATIASNRFIVPQTLTFHVPGPWVRQLHPFVAYTRGAEYFNSEAVPDEQNIMTYGVDRPLGHGLALHADVFNLRQTHGAASFPGQETAHFANIEVNLSYRSPL